MSRRPPQPTTPPPSTKPYPCTCLPSNQGIVLLFYRYYAKHPTLPSIHSSLSSNPSALATWHTDLATSLNLTGKLRLAREGFNITIAGTTADITAYITQCIQHWSFDGLSLHSSDDDDSDNEAKARRNAFFKPTPGCACVFPAGLVVKVVEEITPMAVTGYVPADWGIVREVEAAEWHHLLGGASSQTADGGDGSRSTGSFVGKGAAPDAAAAEITLLDVRNHYESALGYFVSGDSITAPTIRPQVRRFSQFPQAVWRGRLGLENQPLGAAIETETVIEQLPGSKPKQQKQIFSYCTGGIRCEKATRFLAEHLTSRPTTSSLPTSPDHDSYTIITLRGGIASYLSWVDGEIAAERMTARDSLFKGRNYVFDARGSVGLAGGGDAVVGVCVACGAPGEKGRTCASEGCRVEVVVCEDCVGVVVGGDKEENRRVSCCADCWSMSEGSQGCGITRRRMCQCEIEREAKLWGFESGHEGGQVGQTRQERRLKQGQMTKMKIKTNTGDEHSERQTKEEKNQMDIRVATIPAS